MEGPITQHTSLKYRPDIDGLRAVAILSVFAFHLSPTVVSGGFVGVDVFFVISGYLISAIVFSEIAASQFSVLAFYERRVRRIFPALFAMLIIISIVISFFLLPTEFVEYAKSVIAATASSSNFYFWQHSGYFDLPLSNPLLHTWSLAVEEQFYILFPIFLILTRRFFEKQLKLCVVCLFFVSLFASVITLNYNSTTAFYMPYTRTWELLMGTILSLGILPRLKNAWPRNGATLLGLALIVFSVLRYTPQTSFPGLAAVIPCLGSALIIAAGECGPSLIGRVLSWRPMVFIGLISYSLYLWHWPVIILNNLGLSVNLSGLLPDKLAFLLLSQTVRKSTELLLAFVLATLSWSLVERPFRSHAKRIKRRSLFALSGAVMAVLILSSAAVIRSGGFSARFPPKAVQVASFLAPPGATTLGQLGTCEITEGNVNKVFADDSYCLESMTGSKDYLLIGDSHAGSLLEGLKTSLPTSNIALAAVWGCRPSVLLEGTALCKRMMDFVFQKYLPSHPVQGLLVEARWYSKDLGALEGIASWAKAHDVFLVVFGPVAEYDAPLPRLLAYSIAWNKPGLAQQHRLAYSPIMDDQMQKLAESIWHVSYVSIYKATCDPEGCLEYADKDNGIPLLNDGDHFSQAGSRVIVGRLFELGKMHFLNREISAKSSASKSHIY